MTTDDGDDDEGDVEGDDDDDDDYGDDDDGCGVMRTRAITMIEKMTFYGNANGCNDVLGA